MLLITTFIIGLLIRRFIKREGLGVKYIARISMCIMLIFTGISHFIFTNGMAKMLPFEDSVSQTTIYVSGILEIVLGLCLISKRYYKTAGILTIIFLLMVLPANIYAAFNNIDPITGTNQGSDSTYLWFRVPLQMFFMVWVYFSTHKKNKTKTRK